MTHVRWSERRSYFEDVELGVSCETPGMTLTEAHVGLFAGVTGAPLPASGVVPSLLPLCVSSGLGWRVSQPPLVILAFMGLEWRTVLPVAVGDTIRCRARALTKRSMKEGGVVVEEREIVNQRGEVVQSSRVTLLVAKRPAP